MVPNALRSMANIMSGCQKKEALLGRNTRFPRILWPSYSTYDFQSTLRLCFNHISFPQGTTSITLPQKVAPINWYRTFFLNHMRSHAIYQESPSPSSFCVASYNVMADVFSPPSQFPTHNPAHVGWMHRGPRIAQEIADVRADLLCLQELGADPEGAHLRPLLTSRGYEYLYKPNAWREGCAVYWRKDMYWFFFCLSVSFV